MAEKTQAEQPERARPAVKMVPNPAPVDELYVDGVSSLISRSGVVKFYFPLRARRDMKEDEAQLYWRTNHGPLIRRQAAASGILRYVQVHRFETELEAALREPRGTSAEPYTGHAELWFDRREMGVRSPEREIAGQRAIEDESKFIDFERSSMWLAKEHVIIDRM